MKVLTKRQNEVLNFIISFIEENSYSPAVRDIARHFEITVKAAHDHLKALERKGAIRSTEGISRSTEVIGLERNKERELISIPVLGATAAGSPLLAEENFEHELTFPADMFSSSGPFFALHVEGDSMTEAGIFDGDLAIIQKIEQAKNGEIVVARVGEENHVTLKRYYLTPNAVELRPENPKYGSIYSQDIKILGRLFLLIRDYGR